MKFTAKVISALAIVIFLAGGTEFAHAEKIFVRSANFTPPRVRQPFPSAFKTPTKDYPSRVPVRPKPRNFPSKPKPSHENRGGGGKFFGVPRAPQR